MSIASNDKSRDNKHACHTEQRGTRQAAQACLLTARSASLSARKICMQWGAHVAHESNVGGEGGVGGGRGRVLTSRKALLEMGQVGAQLGLRGLQLGHWNDSSGY